MRTVAAGSFERLSSVAALWAAFSSCRKNKRRTPSMAAFDLDADRLVFKLHRDLVAQRYRPGTCALRIVREPKKRLIAAAPVRDRVVHRALVDAIAAPFEARFIDQSYAGIEGRGAHRAVLWYLAELRRRPFRMALDIRRYFPSIHLPTLHALVAERVADAHTLDLLAMLLRAGSAVYRTAEAYEVLGLAADPLRPDCGMPVGSYLSQWSGNVYLDGLDHLVKRTLKLPGYLRYMDDFVLFAESAGQLEEARDAITSWLQAERRLELNAKRGQVLPAEEPAVFLGYRVSRAGVSPSRKLRSRMARKLNRAARKGPPALERCVRAYRGLLTFG